MELKSVHDLKDSVSLCEPCQQRCVGSLAVKFCKNCKEQLCVTCADVHQSSKATRRHLIINIDDISPDTVIEQDFEQFQKCKNHPEKGLEYFCIHSGQFLCSTCIITQKPEATNICDINSAGEKLIEKRYSDMIIAELDNIIKTCKQEETNINNIKQACFMNRQELEKQLQQTRLNVLTILDQHEQQILRQVTTNEQSLISLLNPQLQMVIDKRKTFEKNRHLYDAVVRNGSKGDVFRCSFSVARQLDDLKEKPLGKEIKYDVPSNIIKWSPVMFSFVNNFMPAMWCETFFIERDSARFKTFKVGRSSLIKAIKQTTIESRNNAKLGDYAMSSADADCEDISKSKTFNTDRANKCKHALPVKKSTTETVQSLTQPTFDRNVKPQTKKHELVQIPETVSKDSNNVLKKNTNDSTTNENLQIQSDSSNLGQTTVNDPKHTASGTALLENAEYDVTINLLLNSQANMCYIQGIATTLDGGLVLTDAHESKIIMMNRDFKFVNSIALQWMPGKIAVMNERYVAVCMPKTTRVAICEIKPEFRWVRNFITVLKPRDVSTVAPDKILLSMIDDNKQWHLRVLSTDGKTLINVARNRSFMDASAVSVQTHDSSNGMLYLQFCKVSRCLYCFDKNGFDDFEYQVESAGELCVGAAGLIYLIENTGTLHILSEEGQIIKKKKTVRNATGITYNPTTKALIIVSKYQVYEIKENNLL